MSDSTRIPALQITMWTKEITDTGEERRKPSKYDTDAHPLTVRFWDDDGILYAEGTCKDDDESLMTAFNYMSGSYGTTLMKMYNRKTGAYIDGIG